ncbi:MAG: hypothetical protein RL129_649 [Actinomycetota bacterium]|jgi:hypothetical protein
MANQVETIISVQTENRDRASVFLRGVLILPIFIYLCTLTQTFHWGLSSGLVTLPVVLTLVFRGIYPSYVLNFNHALMELSTRVATYVFFLNDDYPSIEPNPRTAILFPDIEGGRKLSRWKPILKFIFAIPHYILGVLYLLASILLTVLAWIHILLTGKYPDPALKIVVGTIRYWNRVIGYAGVLVTDEYPGFGL